MYTGQSAGGWQSLLRWLILLAFACIIALSSLMEESSGAHTQGQAHSPFSPWLTNSTPGPDFPTLLLTPGSGPVGTMVNVQGSNWPSGSTVLLKYSSTDCDSPDAQEIPHDPKPAVDSAGNFSARFPWPAVSDTGLWHVCAVTSDGTIASDSFNVLSLTPPSVSIVTTGKIQLGQTITVSGQNWLPGGLLIAFSLQPVGSDASFFLEGYAVSLINGAFDPRSTTLTIPATLRPGSYILIASAEQEALQAQTSAFTITAAPTPTPSPTPSPSPTPEATSTPTVSPAPHPQPPHHQLSGPLLSLLIISGSMALLFALAGTALLLYLARSRHIAGKERGLSHYDKAEQLSARSGG